MSPLLPFFILSSCRLHEEVQASAHAAAVQALQHDPPHAYIAHIAHVSAALDSLVAAVQDATACSSSTRGHSAAAGALALPSSRSSSRQSSSRRGAGGAGGHGSGFAALVLADCDAAAVGLRGGGGGSVGSSSSSSAAAVGWVKGVVVKLKELLLESDRCVDCGV